MEARVVWDHEGVGSIPAGSTGWKLKLPQRTTIPVDRHGQGSEIVNLVDAGSNPAAGADER